jgi:hypothetical protein
LKHPDFEELEETMRSVILMGLENRNLGTQVKEQNTLRLLDPVQKRLVHANLVRRNRIYLATEDMRAAVEKRKKEEQRRGREALEDKTPQLAPVVGRARETRSTVSDLEESKPVRSDSIPPLHAPSIETPSVTKTATDIRSDFKIKPTTLKKALTIMTSATRIGNLQDYPRCPKRPESGGLALCPYCAEPLDADYEKNVSRWR